MRKQGEPPKPQSEFRVSTEEVPDDVLLQMVQNARRDLHAIGIQLTVRMMDYREQIPEELKDSLWKMWDEEFRLVAKMASVWDSRFPDINQLPWKR